VHCVTRPWAADVLERYAAALRQTTFQTAWNCIAAAAAAATVVPTNCMRPYRHPAVPLPSRMSVGHRWSARRMRCDAGEVSLWCG